MSLGKGFCSCHVCKCCRSVALAALPTRIVPSDFVSFTQVRLEIKLTHVTPPVADHDIQHDIVFHKLSTV